MDDNTLPQNEQNGQDHNSHGEVAGDEIDREQDVLMPASPPSEEGTDPNIVEILDHPLDEDKFLLGVESNYDETKQVILGKSKDAGAQYVWVDAEFAAEEKSLYFSEYPFSKWKDFEWKRPHDISKNPRLIQDDIASGDIIQGRLGDCWWLSSVAAVSRRPPYMRRLIPSDQSLEGEDYAGMFHFRFWRFGKWVDVIVDDQLPTNDYGLAFGKSNDPDEFWLPFLEKAYAKLHGSYQAIEGGFAQDALEDLTGGIAIVFDLGAKTPKHLFKSLVKAMKNHSFATCSIEGSGEMESSRTGLVSAHAYTLTGAKSVKYRGSHRKIVRVRNPWGNEVEWKGAWSDSDYHWDKLDSDERDALEYADKDDGEWWMEFDDFTKHFNNCTICTIGPDFDSDGAPTGDRWFLSKAKGAWIKGVSAGGVRNDVYSFATNPQYYLELREPDDFDPEQDDPEEEGKCSVVMGLMQEYRRVGKAEGLKNLYLGLTVYKLKEKPTGRIHVDHFRYNRDHVNTGAYINRREVSLTTELEPGHYVLIPTTFQPDKAGSFLIRIFTEKEARLEELH